MRKLFDKILAILNRYQSKYNITNSHLVSTEKTPSANCAIILSNIPGQQKSYLIPNVIFSFEDPSQCGVNHLQSIEKTETHLNENGFTTIPLRPAKQKNMGFYKPTLTYLHQKSNKGMLQFPPQFFNLN